MIICRQNIAIDFLLGSERRLWVHARTSSHEAEAVLSSTFDLCLRAKIIDNEKKPKPCIISPNKDIIIKNEEQILHYFCLASYPTSSTAKTG